jgi:hypothetical protein
MVMLYESPYQTLADILASRNVGLTHVRLVGDVIVAQAVLNEWLAKRGKATLLPDEWVEITERALVVEDAYNLLWRELSSSGAGPIQPDGLRDLENALRNAASTFNAIFVELTSKHG